MKKRELREWVEGILDNLTSLEIFVEDADDAFKTANHFERTSIKCAKRQIEKLLKKGKIFSSSKGKK